MFELDSNLDSPLWQLRLSLSVQSANDRGESALATVRKAILIEWILSYDETDRVTHGRHAA